MSRHYLHYNIITPRKFETIFKILSCRCWQHWWSTIPVGTAYFLLSVSKGALIRLRWILANVRNKSYVCQGGGENIKGPMWYASWNQSIMQDGSQQISGTLTCETYRANRNKPSNKASHFNKRPQDKKRNRLDSGSLISGRPSHNEENASLAHLGCKRGHRRRQLNSTLYGRGETVPRPELLGRNSSIAS